MERKDVTVNLGTARAVAGAGLGATPPTGDAEAGDGHLDASDQAASGSGAARPITVKRPLETGTSWTYEVGPSGFNLQRGEPTQADLMGGPADGYVSVYIDLGQISRILELGHELWGERWREQLLRSLRDG